MPPKQTKTAASGSPTAYLISSRKEGFRRAGRAWSQTPELIAAAELSEEMLDALFDEPMIRIECVFDEPAATLADKGGE